MAPAGQLPAREALIVRAHQSIARGSQSFALASLLFDRATRDRAHLLYAWCRRCDDIADGQDHGGPLAGEAGRAIERVAAIRVLTRRALDRRPTNDSAFDALGQVASETGLSGELCDDVIDGFALDALGWRPRTEGDLMRYCYHVAGAVGVLMARVMGVPADEHDTLDRACDLGLAFQLSNIARDIGEDDAAGRCYIPGEWLAQSGIPAGQHMQPAFRGQLVAITARMLDLAGEHEAAARLGAARLAFRQRWAVLAAANIYGAIGRKVRQQADRAWDSRVHTTRLEKAGHVLAALIEAITGARQPHAWPRWTRNALIAIASADRPALPAGPSLPSDEEAGPPDR